MTPYEANDPSLDVNMMHVKMCFWLILVISEIAFFLLLSEQHYWRSMGAGMYSYDPDEEECAWMQTFLRGSLDAVEGETEAHDETSES